jgi:hypothetical protein
MALVRSVDLPARPQMRGEEPGVLATAFDDDDAASKPREIHAEAGAGETAGGVS